MPNKYTTVAEFLDDLDAAKREQVELLRSVIQEVHPGMEEHIKWNAPSFVLDGEDRVTFNLQNKEGVVKLVLHMGATREENKKGAPIMPNDHGLLTWPSDIRGVMSFKTLGDITAKRAEIADLITRWLAIS
jgi:hypothetical protein